MWPAPRALHGSKSVFHTLHVSIWIGRAWLTFESRAYWTIIVATGIPLIILRRYQAERSSGSVNAISMFGTQFFKCFWGPRIQNSSIAPMVIGW